MKLTINYELVDKLVTERVKEYDMPQTRAYEKIGSEMSITGNHFRQVYVKRNINSLQQLENFMAHFGVKDINELVKIHSDNDKSSFSII